MFFPEARIRSVAEFLSAVERLRRRRRPVWYRGSTDAGYKLIPSLGRPPFQLQHERVLLNSFKQNAVQFVDERPLSEWEWLFLARHHSVPTRLLDWTESPLIGLYFATTSAAGPERNANKDGVLWVLLPTELNRRAAISLPDRQALPIFEDDDPHLRQYLPKTLASELSSVVIPAAGIAIRHSKRMQAQHSVFTVTHRNQTPLEEIGNGAHVGRFIVPARFKARVRRQLEVLKIDRLAVFPELDNAALLARRQYDG